MSDTASATLIKNAKNLENGNLAIVATLALLLWDWMISFEREWEHFWIPVNRWNTGTYLFFLNRLLPIMNGVIHLQTTVVSFSPSVQQQVCKPLLRTVYLLTPVNLAVVQVILALRTYALYDCSFYVLLPLMALLLGGLANQFIALLIHHSSILTNSLPAPYTGCLLIGLPTWSWERLVPILVFEFCVLALTGWKFWTYRQSGTTSQIPKILFRDGFIGCIAVCLSTAFGLFVQILRPQAILTLGIALTPVVPTLLASHMLLNIRDVMKLSSVIVARDSSVARTEYTRRRASEGGPYPFPQAPQSHEDDNDDDDDDPIELGYGYNDHHRPDHDSPLEMSPIKRDPLRDSRRLEEGYQYHRDPRPTGNDDAIFGRDPTRTHSSSFAESDLDTGSVLVIR